MTEIILRLLKIREQVQILHWQTKSYARHKAYDLYYEELSDLIDAFTESYQGKYGRIELPAGSSLALEDIKELDLNAFLEGIIEMLKVEISANLDDSDTDLLNIRDEMIGLTNKLVYLLTLK